ncbi:amidase family protein [Streptomyces sp. NPDC000395]|uniref:amidase family protein n=1 Tax=Streptomyces sp. NPDC000395 TaxID=3154252 RepID=UPI00336A38E3
MVTGIAEIGIGTDTSGSVRVPAALCGLVGWRPSQGRHPRAGVLPLAPSLDTVGVITQTVPRLLAVDAALRPDRARPAPVRPPEVTLVVPDGALPQTLDPPVRARFELTLTALERAGVQIRRRAVGALSSVHALLERYGPLVAHEAAATTCRGSPCRWDRSAGCPPGCCCPARPARTSRCWPPPPVWRPTSPRRWVPSPLSLRRSITPVCDQPPEAPEEWSFLPRYHPARLLELSP